MVVRKADQAYRPPDTASIVGASRIESQPQTYKQIATICASDGYAVCCATHERARSVAVCSRGPQACTARVAESDGYSTPYVCPPIPQLAEQGIAECGHLHEAAASRAQDVLRPIARSLAADVVDVREDVGNHTRFEDALVAADPASLSHPLLVPSVGRGRRAACARLALLVIDDNFGGLHSTSSPFDAIYCAIAIATDRRCSGRSVKKCKERQPYSSPTRTSTTSVSTAS